MYSTFIRTSVKCAAGEVGYVCHLFTVPGEIRLHKQMSKGTSQKSLVLCQHCEKSQVFLFLVLHLGRSFHKSLNICLCVNEEGQEKNTPVHVGMALIKPPTHKDILPQRCSGSGSISLHSHEEQEVL